jgi:hypothetical protein
VVEVSEAPIAKEKARANGRHGDKALFIMGLIGTFPNQTRRVTVTLDHFLSLKSTYR